MAFFDDPLSLMPDPAHTTNLSFGDVAGQLSLDLLRALLAQPHGASIHVLDLSRQHLPPEAIDLLIEDAQLLDHLQWLDLSFNPIRGSGLARLLAAPFTSLRGMKLEHISMWRGECHLIQEISKLPNSLKHIDLAANHLTDQGITHVAAWPLLARIEALGLRDNSLTDDAIDALTDPSCPLSQGQLSALDLSYNRLGDEAIARLIRSPTFAHLAHLDIAHTTARRGALEALGEHSATLETLSLNATGCGTLAMKRFGKCAPHGSLATLEVLDLNACALKDAGLEVLLERDDFEALHTLVLSRNALTDHAVSKLPQSAIAASLQHLHLDANSALTLDAILTLLDTDALPKLQMLSINDTALSEEQYSLIAHITNEQGQRLHTWRRG